MAESRKKREAREAVELAEWRRFGRDPLFLLRRIAGMDPIAGDEWTSCFFCGNDEFDIAKSGHREECVWQRARLIIGADPEPPSAPEGQRKD